MPIRIHKFLAQIGVDSKRHIEQMIEEGRITVNGEKRRKQPIFVDPDDDEIAIDGVVVNSPSRRQKGRQKDPRPIYIVLNKPEKVYCTNVAQGEQLRAIDLLPPDFRERVFPVGRLDAESRGLLLLTNDGDLANLLTHPRYGIAKTYRAVVDGWVEGTTISKLMAGIWLADKEDGKGFKAKASKVEIVKRLRDKSVLDITLEEGRNRQIRRMLAGLGHKVRQLTRVRFGPLDLNKLKLKPGESRPLGTIEVEKLRRVAAKAAEAAPPPREPKPKKRRPLPRIKKLNVGHDAPETRPAPPSHPLGAVDRDDELPEG